MHRLIAYDFAHLRKVPCVCGETFKETKYPEHVRKSKSPHHEHEKTMSGAQLVARRANGQRIV